MQIAKKDKKKNAPIRVRMAKCRQQRIAKCRKEQEKNQAVMDRISRFMFDSTSADSER